MLFITVVNTITGQVNCCIALLIISKWYKLLSACLANIWYCCMVIHSSWPRS